MKIIHCDSSEMVYCWLKDILERRGPKKIALYIGSKQQEEWKHGEYKTYLYENFVFSMIDCEIDRGTMFIGKNELKFVTADENYGEPDYLVMLE